MSDVRCLSFHELSLEGSRLSILFFESFQMITMLDLEPAIHYQPLS